MGKRRVTFSRAFGLKPEQDHERRGLRVGNDRGGAWDFVRVSDVFVVDILGSETLDQGGVERPKARPETLYRSPRGRPAEEFR